MMKKLSISAKMIMAFAGLLAMIAGIGAFAVFKIGEVNDLSAQMRTRWLPATQLIGDLHAYTSQYRIAQSGLVLRSEEHTSELQSLMRISYAVFCLKKKRKKKTKPTTRVQRSR